MIGSEIKTLAEDILDNNVEWSDEHFYILLNVAKTRLEEMRLWQYLKKLNSSNQASSSAITLPDDFAQDYKVTVGLDTEYFPVSFEEQALYRNSSNRYYIDWAALTINLLGTIRAGILYLFYKRFTPDITESTSPVFPARFHPLLAYYVAAIYQTGTDSDDIFARMGPVNRQAAMELQRAMTSWDTSLAMRMQNDRVGMNDGSMGDVPLSMM